MKTNDESWLQNLKKALKNVTVISHRIPGSLIIGMALMHVIGPVEMDYRRVISLVNVIRLGTGYVVDGLLPLPQLA